MPCKSQGLGGEGSPCLCFLANEFQIWGLTWHFQQRNPGLGSFIYHCWSEILRTQPRAFCMLNGSSTDELRNLESVPKGKRSISYFVQREPSMCPIPSRNTIGGDQTEVYFTPWPHPGSETPSLWKSAKHLLHCRNSVRGLQTELYRQAFLCWFLFLLWLFFLYSFKDINLF